MSASEHDTVSAVRQVMERYIDATFRADIVDLRHVFHPAAAMSGYLGDDLITGSPEPFFADLASRPSMADTGAEYVARIGAVAVSGRIASATLEESGFFGSMSFVNYFHLIHVGGEWKIVGKTFASR